MKHIFGFLLILFFAFYVQSQRFMADLVVINAKVRTMDESKSEAQALAVSGNKIIIVGTNEEVKPLVGEKTRVIDAQGKLILPGFNDAHLHFMEGGASLASVDLRDAASPEEFVRRIKEYAEKLPKGRWILQGNWDHEKWSPSILPTKEMIDPVTPNNPVFIQRLDGHMALANSLALKLAGVDKNTKDVEGGEIVRDAEGNPTGILKDAAMNYVYRVIPEPSFEEKLEMAEAATNYAASLGVTSVQDMSAGTDVGVYQELLRRGKLKTRIYAVSPLPDWERWKRTGIQYAFGNEMLRVGGLKGFADGSLGASTAWFFESYLDRPNYTGLASDEMPKMYERVKGADKAGLQVMIHAIGDRANDEILKIYEAVEKENGSRDRRFRIEHAQHLNENLIKRFAKQRVIASMQPFHVIDDGRWAWKRLDEKRLKGTYAFRSLLDSGAILAFGTDWPVALLNPMMTIYAAVTRRTLDDKNPNGWIPEQKITVEETVKAYTLGSAYAEFQENVKGTISVGKLADFVMLSEDIFTINPVDIPKVKVLLTVVDGKIVYEAR
ncbi:MAG: amidohydrolase [Acidobacteriota bacterium]|nr:amidohydrolase [Pyrinomonadaceae bacterium]MDW8303965.1 amidohydrolase [Acidobacteriota bacterium]